MQVQVSRCSGRPVTINVGGTGNDGAPHLAQFAADQTGVEHLADAYGAIHAFVQQVDQAVAEIERDANLGMLVHVALDERYHVLTSKSGRRRYLEVSADAQAAERNSRLGIHEIGQDALAFLEK